MRRIRSMKPNKQLTADFFKDRFTKTFELAKNVNSKLLMALHKLNFPRLFSIIHRSTVYFQYTFKQSAPSKNSGTVDLDNAVDNFTTELLLKKKQLWDARNQKRKSMSLHIKNTHFNSSLNVQSLSKEQLYEVLNCALVECNDTAVIALVKECCMYRVSPSQDLILQTLNICAQNGEIDLIQNLEELCKDKGVLLPTNITFDIFKAHAVWMRGNVIKGLEIFQELYTINPFLRRFIRITFKQLVSMGIKNNSEAVLIHFLKFAKYIIEHHKDYFFLICIWEYCLTSEWYSDQQLALDILIKHKKLAELLTNRLPFLLVTALKNHKRETISKLLEVFHNMEMGEQSTIVAMALLDYHFLQVNIGSYSEVIRWCKQSNIALPSIYNQKYLNLLLKIDGHNVSAINRTKLNDRSKEFVF